MIPIFEPDIQEADIQAVVAALRAGEISGLFGESLSAFESAFAEYVGVRHGVAVTSGTTALHLAVAALDLDPGDEILVSASTNVATALAAFHNGCIPIPIDSESDSWNLDIDLIEASITERTRAIIPVHLFGHPVDMDRMMEISERHQLVVIEDCAESHGATCRGRMTGSFGAMGCFSFYANKIITTGEGGMVVSDDDDLANKLRSLRNLAFTQPRFRHEEGGFNFRMTGYQAAMGRSQLARIEDVIEAKRKLATTYTNHLSGIAGLQLPFEAPWARHVYWMYGVVVEDDFGVTRDQLAEHLGNDGIETRTFFCPMNMQPFLQEHEGFSPIECPVAEELWECGLYLPSSTNLNEATIERISDAIRKARDAVA